MQQIYRRTPMPKCDFNKVALRSTWAFSCKFDAYFRNTFTKNPSGWLLFPSIFLISIYTSWFSFFICPFHHPIFDSYNKSLFTKIQQEISCKENLLRICFIYKIDKFHQSELSFQLIKSFLKSNVFQVFLQMGNKQILIG